jgi:hypothetical protein
MPLRFPCTGPPGAGGDQPHPYIINCRKGRSYSHAFRGVFYTSTFENRGSIFDIRFFLYCPLVLTLHQSPKKNPHHNPFFQPPVAVFESQAAQ